MSRELEPWEWEYLRQVGRRVRMSRFHAELTQQELAGRAGVHRVTLNNVERGDHATNVLTFLRLSRPLGVWMGALLNEELLAAQLKADRVEGLPS